MHTSVPTRLSAFALTSLITLALLSGLDALATTGQSADALLAQKRTLQLACTDDNRRS